MFKIMKWLFYGFVFVMLWQISQAMDSEREQLGNATLRFGNDFEKRAQNAMKKDEKKVENKEENLADSVERASRQYISEIMQ